MIVSKFRVPMDDNGLVPAGEYFKRLAAALRERNERQEMEAHARRSNQSHARRKGAHETDHARAR